MRLLPREERFFTLFLDQVKLISSAAERLLQGVRRGNSDLAAAAAEITRYEQQGDEVIHDIFTRLNQTFITPLDPEDIHSLSSHLDDVLDGIEDAAHRINAYRIEPIPAPVIELCEIVHASATSLGQAFDALNKDQKMLEYCIEVNRLEGLADQVLRRAVEELFTTCKDAITIMKLKEIYEFLEQTTDRCEDVADALQNVVVKNS